LAFIALRAFTVVYARRATERTFLLAEIDTTISEFATILNTVTICFAGAAEVCGSGKTDEDRVPCRIFDFFAVPVEGAVIEAELSADLAGVGAYAEPAVAVIGAFAGVSKFSGLGGRKCRVFFWSIRRILDYDVGIRGGIRFSIIALSERCVVLKLGGVCKGEAIFWLDPEVRT